MKKCFLNLIIIFTIHLNLSSAWADCGYRLDNQSLHYNFSDNNLATQATVSITRQKDNGVNCANFFLAYTKGWSGNYNRRVINVENGNILYYNIFKNSNLTGVLKESGDISSPDETFIGSLGKNQTNYYSYYLDLAPLGATLPAAGIYLDQIQIQAYSGTYSNVKSFETARDLSIVVTVPKLTSISLVESGGSYDPAQTSKTLDFGELESNEELGFDVRVVTNAGYKLKISSSNNGLLKIPGSNNSSSQISYSFYSNGSLINLGSSASSSVTIASGTGVTTAQGAKVPIRIVIGSVDAAKSPGTYQDYLTLSTISSD
jgi:hypothetical protein